MNIISRRSLLLAVCLAMTLASAGDIVRLVPTFTKGSLTPSGGGTRNLIAGDIDGDGRAELVTCTDDAPYALQAQSDGTYAALWRGSAAGCTAATVADRNSDGGMEVITVSGTRLMIYDPRRLAGPVHTITIPGSNVSATDVVAGNVDGDPAPEIVVVTSQATHVFDGATLELQWSATGYGGSTVDIGDVDGTTQREIVVSGSNGYVLDAVAESEKWGYVGGFSTSWDLGNVDADAKEEIVFRSSSSQVTILHGDTFATSTITVQSADALVVGDANGDGAPEILTGNDSWGDIEGRNPTTGAIVWTIDNPTYGTVALGTANLDADATPEVFWFAGAVYISDTTQPAHHWRSSVVSGPFMSATADLDGDGRIEFLIGARSASTASGTGQSTPLIEVRDLQSGEVEQTFLLPAGYSSLNLHALSVGQLDADPQLEIAALAGYGSVNLYVWDSDSGAVQFSNTASSYSYGSGEDSFLIANLDADAVDEIVVATSSAILVLNGASNIIQKSLPRSNLYSHDFALADLNGDATLDLVVAHSQSLVVYDTSTWALLGSQPLDYSGADSVDATSADGGTVVITTAAYYSPALRLFKGATLVPEYSCPLPGAAQARFGEVAGEERLVVLKEGRVSFYPMSAEECPTIEDGTYATERVSGMLLADATGDGRNELILHGETFLTVAFAGVSTEMRGDVDGDQVISVDDLDATADYLFGALRDSTPSADVNADERISVDDLFQLINHELAGGAAPQP